MSVVSISAINFFWKSTAYSTQTPIHMFQGLQYFALFQNTVIGPHLSEVYQSSLCTEFYFHFNIGRPSCYLRMLKKLKSNGKTVKLNLVRSFPLHSDVGARLSDVKDAKPFSILLTFGLNRIILLFYQRLVRDKLRARHTNSATLCWRQSTMMCQW